MLAYEKYATPEMLEILQHNFSTQKNESMNYLVATLLAPKMLTGVAYIVAHYELSFRILFPWMKIS